MGREDQKEDKVVISKGTESLTWLRQELFGSFEWQSDLCLPILKQNYEVTLLGLISSRSQRDLVWEWEAVRLFLSTWRLTHLTETVRPVSEYHRLLCFVFFLSHSLWPRADEVRPWNINHDIQIVTIARFLLIMIRKVSFECSLSLIEG